MPCSCCTGVCKINDDLCEYLKDLVRKCLRLSVLQTLSLEQASRHVYIDSCEDCKQKLADIEEFVEAMKKTRSVV